jgi:hypothetical protein
MSKIEPPARTSGNILNGEPKLSSLNIDCMSEKIDATIRSPILTPRVNRKSPNTIHSPTLAPPTVQFNTSSQITTTLLAATETLVGSTFLDQSTEIVSEDEESERISEVNHSRIDDSERKKHEGSDASAKQSKTEKTDSKSSASNRYVSKDQSKLKSSSPNGLASIHADSEQNLSSSANHSMDRIDIVKNQDSNHGSPYSSPKLSRKPAKGLLDKVISRNASIYSSAQSIGPELVNIKSVSQNSSIASSVNSTKRLFGPGRKDAVAFETLGIFGTLLETGETVPFINLLYPNTVTSCTEDVTSTKSRRIFKRRVTTFENSVNNLASSPAALFRDRKRSLLGKGFEYVCSGSELAAWFLSSSSGDARLFNIAEATQYLDSMVQYGYLISVVISFTINFRIFQPFLRIMTACTRFSLHFSGCSRRQSQQRLVSPSLLIFRLCLLSDETNEKSNGIRIYYPCILVGSTVKRNP